MNKVLTQNVLAFTQSYTQESIATTSMAPAGTGYMHPTRGSALGNTAMYFLQRAPGERTTAATPAQPCPLSINLAQKQTQSKHGKERNGDSMHGNKGLDSVAFASCGDRPAPARTIPLGPQYEMRQWLSRHALAFVYEKTQIFNL